METKYLRIFLFVICCACCLVLILYLIKFHNGLSNSHNAWGAFGSYFGGTLSVIFSFATTMLLLCTYFTQRKETELKSLDDKFFALLNQKKLMIDSFQHGSYSGTEYFTQRINIIIDRYFSPNSTNTDEYSNYLILFNYILHISKTIHNSPINKEEKKYYYDALKYSLSDSEFKLLIMSRDRKKVSPQYLELIENVLSEFKIISIEDFRDNPKETMTNIAVKKGIFQFTENETSN